MSRVTKLIKERKRQRRAEVKRLRRRLAKSWRLRPWHKCSRTMSRACCWVPKKELRRWRKPAYREKWGEPRSASSREGGGEG